MSYKLFLLGKTPEEIKRIKAQKDYVENPAAEQRRREQLRKNNELAASMQKWHDYLSELERMAWERISGQKHLPKPIL